MELRNRPGDFPLDRRKWAFIGRHAAGAAAINAVPKTADSSTKTIAAISDE